ncbi:MAG: hypothetical protein JW918_19970 [Anaerolineae bacterium]|nr:hypothetical protein [Anaerolineae bacterium]
MSALEPTITTQKSTRRELQAEIRLVTWDDFFPSYADVPKPPPPTGAIPLRPPTTPEVAEGSKARAALKRVVEADSRPEHDLPQQPEAANPGKRQRLGLQRTPRISRRSALAKRKSEALGQEVAGSTLLHLATAELEVGNKEKARQLLEQVLQAEPRSEIGWLRMAEAVDSDREQRFCLEKVLIVNRRNALARRRLEALTTGTTHPEIAKMEDLVEEVKVEPRASENRPLNLHATLQKYAIPTAIVYLGALTIAEALTTLIQPIGGLVLYGVLLTLLIAHTALIWGHPSSRLILTLAFAPLIRMTSLFLPLTNFPMVYWYFIVSVPLFAAAAAAALRTIGFSRKDTGLWVKKLPVQILVILTDLSLGYTEYRILQPATALVREFNFGAV